MAKKEKAKKSKEEKNDYKWIYSIIFWSPRALMIMYISLILGTYIYTGNINYITIGYLSTLFIFLLISWFYPLVGGLSITALSLVLSIYFDAFSSYKGIIFIFLPLLTIGVIFTSSEIAKNI